MRAGFERAVALASASVARALRTGLALVVLPPLLAVLSAVGIVLVLLGARGAALHPFYVCFSRAALLVGGTRLELRGCERLPSDTAYVVICNHESAWDPVCLLAGLPGLTIRFVVKRALMRIPLLGAALRASGNVTVSRTDTRSDVARLERGMREREPGVSMLFFAEGTRSRDGALHAFKKGPFTTAIHHQLPVLPIGIAGTYRIWPKGAFALRSGPVSIAVGEPISVLGVSEADRDALRQRGFGAVRELRGQARARLRERGVEPGGVD